MDYYRLATKSPEGTQWLGDSLHTKGELEALMSDHERSEWTGTWSSDDGFEYWPALEAKGQRSAV